jgi:arginase family enzyme
MHDSAWNRLAEMLAPVGIYTVTTGGSEVGAWLRERWGTDDREAVRTAWREHLGAAAQANVVVVGVPMDAGAGFDRGSFRGPLALRRTLHAAGEADPLRWPGVVDVGDVRVHPQLVHDSLTHATALRGVREARGWTDAHQKDWPVAPLSLLEAVLSDLQTVAPTARCLVVGGDHALSRVPVASWIAQLPPGRVPGILHFDAHTDLLQAREGVEWSFATWAWHANQALAGRGAFVQAGIRVSGRSREVWQAQTGVLQWWAPDINANPDGARQALISALVSAGVTDLYISLDVDATDPHELACTGTPEPGGLTADWIVGTIEAAAHQFDIGGADIVELAPGLHLERPGEPARSLEVTARYAACLIRALGRPSRESGANAV